MKDYYICHEDHPTLECSGFLRARVDLTKYLCTVSRPCDATSPRLDMSHRTTCVQRIVGLLVIPLTLPCTVQVSSLPGSSIRCCHIKSSLYYVGKYLWQYLGESDLGLHIFLLIGKKNFISAVFPSVTICHLLLLGLSLHTSYRRYFQGCSV